MNAKASTPSHIGAKAVAFLPLRDDAQQQKTSFTVSPEKMNMHGRRGCMSIRVAQLTAVFSVSEQVAAGSFAILPAVLSICGNCR